MYSIVLYIYNTYSKEVSSMDWKLQLSDRSLLYRSVSLCVWVCSFRLLNISEYNLYLRRLRIFEAMKRLLQRRRTRNKIRLYMYMLVSHHFVILWRVWQSIGNFLNQRSTDVVWYTTYNSGASCAIQATLLMKFNESKVTNGRYR